MTEHLSILIIGLAGIVATLIASGAGLYFTAKARTGPLREVLYSKQVELLCRIVHRQSRFRVYATILRCEDETDDAYAFKEKAREDIAQCFREFSETQEEAAAVLPTEGWVEIKKLSDCMSGILGEYDESKGIKQASFTNLVARMTKVALLARVVLGVDELTDESLSLFAAAKDYERTASIEIGFFEGLVDKGNKKE